MPEIDYSAFAKNERAAIEARCERIFENISALENEFKLLRSRIAAIDAFENLYSETARELEASQSAIARISNRAADKADDRMDGIAPGRQSIRHPRSRQRVVVVQ